MNWTKEHPFATTITGVTVLATALFIAWGLTSKSTYESNKQEFDSTVEQLTKYKTGILYPTVSNRDNKRIALKEFIEITGNLQDQFDSYRTEAPKNITPQEFTNQLQSSNTKVSEQFQKANITFPDGFLLGFSTYKDSLAPQDATGLLKFQLDSITILLETLIDSKITNLINFYRQPLEEEIDKKGIKVANDKVRYLPIELTFKAKEASLRNFMNTIANNPKHMYLVRSLSFMNEKTKAPVAADAKFAKKDEASIEGNASSENNKILYQVLGNEEITAFLRIDIALIPSKKELPKL